MMKRYYLFLMAIAIAFATVSCGDKEDDNNENGQQSGPVEGYNDLDFIQSNLVEVNEKGEFVKRVNGAALVSGDTTTVYIGRDDLAHAESTFLGWLPPTISVSENGEGFSANLTDEHGNAQGTVYFREALSTEKFHNSQALAVMTFSPETDIKHVKKVVFLPRGAWPLNRLHSPYYVGDLVPGGTLDEGVRRWLCIREAKEGESGMLVYLSERKSDWDRADQYGQFASPSNAQTIYSIIKPRFDIFKTFFAAGGMTLYNDYYWINDRKIVPQGIYCIRFTDGDITWYNTSFFDPEYKYVQAKTFNQCE